MPAATLGNDAPPEAVVEALLPPLPLASGEAGEAPQERFDVTVVDAPARDFFMGLVEGTHYNVALSPDVRGRITLSLRNVTVEEALQTVRHVYGYQYRRTGQGFAILPATLSTRIFELSYLSLQRQGQSETRINSGQLTQGDTSNRNVSVDNTGSRSRGSDKDTVTGSRIETRSKSDLWQELLAAVRTILGGREGRSVVASPNSGLIVVRAMPRELEEVQAFLEAAEKSLTRQVIIEAKILEVRLSDGFQAGINWAAMIEHAGTQGVASQTGGGTSISDGASEIAGKSIENMLEDAELLATATSAYGGVFTLAVQASKFAAFVELLKTQGEVKILSSPRVSTLNNQKAVIRVGTDEFFVTDVSTTTVTGTAVTSTPNVTLTPFFSGIVLDVTPQINEAGDVILHVHPSVSDVQDQTKTISFGTGEVDDDDSQTTLPLALSRIREADSVVRAQSGQVIVIGGLMQSTSQRDTAATPWISQIPLLGQLFRQTRNRDSRSELVILLRPIVVDAETWEERVRVASDRYGSLDSKLLDEGSIGILEPDARENSLR